MTRVAEGLLLVDKPAGITSHDVVERIRRAAASRRVGHAGTLDPPATGLLPVAIGRATRLVRFLPRSPKVYEGTIRLGVKTTTDDLTGMPLARHEGPLPRKDSVLAAAASLRGLLLQTPPRVSAKHVGGERLYRRALKGEEVDAAPVEVEIFRFDLRQGEREADWEFTAEVSGGTYVRSLARDLGAALGCGGALASLRRTAIGPMRVEEATPLAELEVAGREGLGERIIAIEAMPLGILSVALPDDTACRRFLAGSSTPAPASAPVSGPVAVLSPAMAIVGVGEVEGGLLLPRVVLGLPD